MIFALPCTTEWQRDIATRYLYWQDQHVAQSLIHTHNTHTSHFCAGEHDLFLKTDDQIWAGKFFHPSTHHGGESEMEVKNWKNLNPKMVFDQNIFFKIHKFLVISHIDETSWSVHWPQGVYMRLITKNCELYKVDFKWKTPLGSWFFGFFTSKKLPPSYRDNWWKKNFHISMLSLSSLWSQCRRWWGSSTKV